MAEPIDPPCVLLVDDNPIVLQALGMLFASVGWKSCPVESAQLALQKVGSKEYDLAVVDLKMPDMNGFDLCERLHWESSRKGLAVLIHSGYIDASGRAEAMARGATGILEKPMGRNDLIATLRKLGLPCSP